MPGGELRLPLAVGEAGLDEFRRLAGQGVADGFEHEADHVQRDGPVATGSIFDPILSSEHGVKGTG
jgi:hypothetical protein